MTTSLPAAVLEFDDAKLLANTVLILKLDFFIQIFVGVDNFE